MSQEASLEKSWIGIDGMIRLGPVSVPCQVSTTARPVPTDHRLITVIRSLAAMSRQARG